MDLPDQKALENDEILAVEPGWHPHVLDSGKGELPADFDLAEVWQWFHARLRAIGELSHDDARLAALLNWNDRTILVALHAARLHYGEWDGEREALQAQLEFTTAESLARQALDEEPIPTPEIRPA